MAKKTPLVAIYARMWPREVFDRLVSVQGRKNFRSLAKTLDILTKPGVYILYRDGVPYYIGKATRMRSRLWQHAWNPKGRYYNLWNFFSFFAVQDPDQRDEIDRNSNRRDADGEWRTRPNLPREQLDEKIKTMLREIRLSQAIHILKKEN